MLGGGLVESVQEFGIAPDQMHHPLLKLVIVKNVESKSIIACVGTRSRRMMRNKLFDTFHDTPPLAKIK